MGLVQNIPRAWRAFVYGVAAFAAGTSGSGDPSLMEPFIARCRSIPNPRVLELGVKRAVKDRSSRHDAWVPHAAEYLGTDIEAGADVDIVADAHRLSEVVGEKQFDIAISCSTFEHLKYPHLAAHQILRTLKIGGVLFVQTHQSYPLHAYPYDYFRFSREALSGLFGTKMGFRISATGYEFPAVISSKREWLLPGLTGFLLVSLFGEKVAETPEQYIYELDG